MQKDLELIRNIIKQVYTLERQQLTLKVILNVQQIFNHYF